MIIYAIFGVYVDENCGAELLDAWDEVSMEANPDGYNEKLAKLQRSRHVKNVTEIQLELDGEAVRRAVFPEHKLPAEVKCRGEEVVNLT